MDSTAADFQVISANFEAGNCSCQWNWITFVTGFCYLFIDRKNKFEPHNLGWLTHITGQIFIIADKI